MHMISTRLSASIPRARHLGMIIASTISKVVDNAEQALNFDLEEVGEDEVHFWAQLLEIRDSVGTLDDLVVFGDLHTRKRSSPKMSRRRSVKRLAASRPAETSKIIAIDELSDGTSDKGAATDEDENLPRYAKPDSDPSDSDDDPTLVNRNKPTAPVYISSLIKQLNTYDNIPAMELALRSAPTLIRRKANFGDELSANIHQLASSLLNLQDSMSDDEMQHLRLQSLIACFVSKPAHMGPWLVSTYFEGDLSLSVRATLLTALVLGAREIAGHDETRKEPNVKASIEASAFPSKRLPPHLEAVYSSSMSAPVDDLSKTLSYRTLQPMALEAADKVTGPDILKVRTFSSRMQVAAKKAAKQEARTKRIPKDLHKLLAHSIFVPMCSRLTMLLSALSSSPHLATSSLLHPSLLKLSIQTLIVLIATIGPNAMQLATLTRESLLLLTTLHTIPSLAHDPITLPVLLQLLLTLLDLNIEAGPTSEERLVADFGPMIAELISWAGSLGDRVSIPEVQDEAGVGMAMPWPVLVAGIQVKWQEVGRKFQGRMLGLIAGTDFDSF
jgi:telomere length regulation protein